MNIIAAFVIALVVSFVVGLVVGYRRGSKVQSDISTALDKIDTLVAAKESLVKSLANIPADKVTQAQSALLVQYDTLIKDATDEVEMLKSDALKAFQAVKTIAARI
jgi:hypothetical protein